MDDRNKNSYLPVDRKTRSASHLKALIGYSFSPEAKKIVEHIATTIKVVLIDR